MTDSGKDSGTASGAQMVELFVANLRQEVPRLMDLYGRRPTVKEVAFAFSLTVEVVLALWRDAVASRPEELEAIFKVEAPA